MLLPQTNNPALIKKILSGNLQLAMDWKMQEIFVWSALVKVYSVQDEKSSKTSSAYARMRPRSVSNFLG